jgi:hypothetical protein
MIDATTWIGSQLRASSEITDDPSKLARYLFRDGG